MMNLSNIKNPDEKIKEILKEAIKNKENKISKLNSDIDSLKKQHDDGTIFVPLQQEPSFNIIYVGNAITTIIGDILYGFGKGVELIKQDINKQTGGNTLSDKDKEFKEKIKNNTNNLSEVINKAQNNVNNVNKSLDVGTKSLNDSYSKVTELGEIAFKSGIKWIEDSINIMIDVTLDSTGKSHLADMSWQELSPELNKKLLLTAGLLKELSHNPATRQAIKEISKSIAITMVEIMKEIQPELNKITDQSIEMLDEVSEKAVKGATSTGLSVGQAIISEIPFWGGIIDFIIAIGKGFNAIAETYKIFVNKSSPIMINTAKKYVNTEQTVEEGKDRISNAYDNAMNTLNNATNINSGTNNMKGGVFIPDKNINNKILKGGNRLKKTMKLFHNTLPRVKYSYKNIFHNNKKYHKHNNYHKRNKTNKKKRNITRKHNK